MSCVRPRSVFPRRVAELTLLWNEIELPHELARADVERLHHAWRIVAIDESVPHTIADDDEVFVNHWRRRLRVMQSIGRPGEILGQIDFALVAKAWNGLARRGIQRDQPPAAVHEQPPLAFAEPHGDSAVDIAGTVWDLSPVVSAWIERPQLLSAVGIQRHDAVVRRAQVHHVVDDDGSDLEAGGTDVVARNRQSWAGDGFFASAPRPCRRKLADVLAVDRGERGVFHPARITAVDRPVAVGRRGFPAR